MRVPISFSLDVTPCACPIVDWRLMLARRHVQSEEANNRRRSLPRTVAHVPAVQQSGGVGGRGVRGWVVVRYH